MTRVRTAAQKKASDSVEGGTTHVLTPAFVCDGALRDALGATSLFERRETFLIDILSEDEEAFSILQALLEEMRDSENIFVVIEGKLGVKDLKSFTMPGVEIVEHMVTKGREFNIFGLTDALASRDKKTLWILLQDAWREGKTSEEIIGTLFWQLKMMRLAEVTKTADEAGQKPFVYDKAKRALGKFPHDDLSRITHELLMLYHEGHGGKRDIDHSLERWALSL